MSIATQGGRLRPIALGAAVLSAVLAAACATTDSGDTDRPEADGSCTGSGEISIGNACITPKDTGRIAFLSGGAKVFSFSTTSGKGVKDAAAKANIEVDEFYANGDVATMMTQVRQVLTSGKYGGVVFAPVNGQACSVLGDLAAENEVLVVAISNTLCGQDAVGEENWSEGTLQYVGGANIQEGYQTCLESAATIAPGPQKVLQVHGPVDNGVTALTKKAVSAFAKEHPDWSVASPVYTDFTTPSAFNAVQNALQGSDSSDVTLILTDYVDIAAGAAKAVDKEGLAGKVKVMGFAGGSKQDIQSVESGLLTATCPTYPYDMGRTATESIIAAFDGTQPPKFVGNDGQDKPLQMITKADLADFEPTY